MGLDMHLCSYHYYGGKWRDKHHSQEGHTLEISGDFPNKQGFELKDIDTIITNAGYWRKANQIHNWFVENVQEGKDDCRDYYVCKDKLQTLLDLCILTEIALEKGNNEEALKLLPPRKGCFFGSYEIDEWYEEDIKKTIQILEKAIEQNGDYYYSSSW